FIEYLGGAFHGELERARDRLDRDGVALGERVARLELADAGGQRVEQRAEPVELERRETGVARDLGLDLESAGEVAELCLEERAGPHVLLARQGGVDAGALGLVARGRARG